MGKNDEIKKALAKMNPTQRRLAETFVKTHAENAALRQVCEQFETQHNELYALLVAILQACEKEFVIPWEHFNTLHWSEYRVMWEDAPEKGGVVVKLTHFTDEGDE